MKKDMTRRNFLVTAGAAVSATVMGRPFLNIDAAYAQCNVVGGPFVRRDIGELAATDPIIISYRKGIAAMKALNGQTPPNPLSWEFQAAIHGTTATPPSGPTCSFLGTTVPWSTCQHAYGALFFWPWHRMYLYWFERIIREMSCDPNWALPYWNWSCPTQRRLPAMFRDPTNAPELYDATRNSMMNDGTGSLTSLVDPTVGVYASGLAFTDYASASSDGPPASAVSGLQLAPHDSVHDQVNGDMGNINTAALDPIFYVHHANVDRLWNNWLAQGGGRSDPVTDSNWKSQQFCFYCEDGTPVSMTPCDVLQAEGQLGYTYENECPQVKPDCNGSGGFVLLTTYVLNLNLQPFNLGSEKLTVPIGVLPSQFRQAIARGENVVLQLKNVQALHQPGASWEVYFGLPSGGEPTLQSPFFVGAVTLFSVGILDQAHHANQFASFGFVINSAVLATPAGASLSLTFLTHGILINGKPSHPPVKSPANVGSVSLAITKEVPVGPNVNP
jgi:hypothetical protein